MIIYICVCVCIYIYIYRYVYTHRFVSYVSSRELSEDLVCLRYPPRQT